MAIKKSMLYNTLWDSCNTLRSKGGMDATQYKDYVLIILFMKVITDKYYGKKNSIIKVPENANFNKMIELKGKTQIGQKFNEILKQIAEENDLQNIIDVVDFSDETKLGKGKDQIDALTGLVCIFQNPELDFSNNRADDDDILGDAYEFLMKKFASEAGKSKGQFYTPSEVSRVMSKIIGINTTDKSQIYVYDMTCGSGSLLLKAGAEAPAGVKVNLYGQEKDNSTAGLSVMNMFLHGNPTAIIKSDNTLTKPQFIEKGRLKTFDYCVANPPFSVKKWSSGMENQYDRFSLGFPPDSKADYAFLLHMLTSMNPKHGRGAIILPHGVLFRGGQEAKIRENLIEKGYIEGIIGLPANLFYGTGIPACIIILDKKHAIDRKSIFMINASKNYIKDGNKNKLREKDIKKIVDTYLDKIIEENYSKDILIEDIAKEEYNLNITRYIDANEPNKVQDVHAHLNGGIPKYNINLLDKYWKVAPTLKEILFKDNKNANYFDLAVDKNEIENIIKNSHELANYKNELNLKIENWENKVIKIFKNISSKTIIKNFQKELADITLKIFKNDSLIDKYTAYEFFMEYYNDIMKDDVHYIIENDWIPKIRFEEDKNGKIKKNSFDSDLIPKEILINQYFAAQQKEIDSLNLKLEDQNFEYNELIMDNTGDEEIFKEEKITEKIIKKMLKEETDENIPILNKLLEILKIQKELKKQIKSSQETMNNLLLEKYKNISKKESRDLVINCKWLYSIKEKFNDEYDEILTFICNYIYDELDNYEETLSELNFKIKNIEAKVLENLKRMGFKC